MTIGLLCGPGMGVRTLLKQSFLGIFGLLLISAADAAESFSLREEATSTLSGRFAESHEIPFDRVELSIEDLIKLETRRIPLKLWKGRRLYKRKAVFHVQAPRHDLLPHILSFQDKSLLIRMEVFAADRRLGEVRYLRSASILTVFNEVTRWLKHHLLPVADASPILPTPRKTEDPGVFLRQLSQSNKTAKKNSGS